MTLKCYGEMSGTETGLKRTGGGKGSSWWPCDQSGAPFSNEFKVRPEGTSLLVQWLRLSASNAGGLGLIPGQETKIPHAVQCDLKI